MNLLSNNFCKLYYWTEHSSIFQKKFFKKISFQFTPSLDSQIRSLTIKTTHIKEDYSDKNNCSEKESLEDYLKNRVKIIDEYLNQLPRLPKEEEFLIKLKEGYQNRKKKSYVDVYPDKVSLEKTKKMNETTGPHFLNEKQIHSYIENGFVNPLPIHTIQEKTLQAAFNKFSGISDKLNPQEYRNARVRPEWRSKDVLDLACNKEIVAKVSSLLGDNVKVRFAAIHEIAPGVGSFSSLTDNKIPELCAHSDTNLGARLGKRELEGPVIGLDSINAWISINGTDRENGPLYVFPKTHNWAVLTPMKYLDHAKDNKPAFERALKLLSIIGFGNEMIANHALSFDYFQNSEYREQMSKIKRVEIYTKPKDCLIFSTHLLHGSDFNKTPHTRLAISIRYSRATTKDNDDNLKAVKEMFPINERIRLGLDEDDDRNPIIQVMGKEYHEKSKPINVDELRKILEEKHPL